MFLRTHHRRKYGKDHYYFSVVENRRVGRGRTVQRQVLYLGELNDSQQAAWHQTLEVFDEQRQSTSQMSLFPEDREIPLDAVNALAQPFGGTLYFAGEATDTGWHWGTVHGAIASGLCAASQAVGRR